MYKISLNVDESILQRFDSLWKSEGWATRQEAIVFLMVQALSRGYILKEKMDLMKSVGGERHG